MKQSEIDEMSVKEKLQAIEALWDALDDGIESPEWHYDVLKERNRLVDSDDADYGSLDALKKGI